MLTTPVRTFLLISLLTSTFFQSFSQTNKDKKYLLTEIVVKGNEKTKKQVILRELTFKAGDSLQASAVDSLKILNENNIFNLSLFLEVYVDFQIQDSQKCFCQIEVKERFFTIPGFYAELADRTFNEWWFLHHHQLNRVDVGFLLTQKNCRGRNETLSAYVQAGYSHRLTAAYSIPGLNQKRNSGFELQFQYLANREFAYSIDSLNRLVYFRGDDYQRKRMKTSLFYYYRVSIYSTHQAELSYQFNRVTDTILSLNPDYLGNNRLKNSFLSLNYTFDLDHTDIHFYPEKGYVFQLNAEFSGLGISKYINQFNLSGTYSAFYSPMPKVLMAHQLRGFYCSEKKLSFLFSPSFGYEDILVRTFEYYLIKGRSGFLLKNDIKYNLLNETLNIRFLRWHKFNTIPIRLYPKVFFDAGYVSDKAVFREFSLNNKLLTGGGIGFDLVSYYDIVVRMEVGTNNLGEKHIFVHFRKAI